MQFTDILASSIVDDQKGRVYSLDASWMQGRAIYGGLSAALCYDAVCRSFNDLPMLRSANISFVGPASEVVWAQVSTLRRGKSVAFIQADLIGESGLITRAVFGFGAKRASQLDEVYYDLQHASVSPEECEDFFVAPEGASTLRSESSGPPSFTQHFDARLAAGSRPFSGAQSPSFELWVKHRDSAANDMTALIALADMPPPAVLPLAQTLAPISSMTWMFNILTDDIANVSRWWLMGLFAEHASQGYSSQNMTIHNDRGELVIAGRQNVAIFF